MTVASGAVVTVAAGAVVTVASGLVADVSGFSLGAASGGVGISFRIEVLRKTA